MKNKVFRKLSISRETVHRLEGLALEGVVGAATLACTTVTRPGCSGCESCTCPTQVTCPP